MLLSSDVYVPLVGEKIQGQKRKRNPTNEEMTKCSNEQKKKKIDGNLKEFLPASNFLEREKYGNICWGVLNGPIWSLFNVLRL